MQFVFIFQRWAMMLSGRERIHVVLQNERAYVQVGASYVADNPVLLNPLSYFQLILFVVT